MFAFIHKCLIIKSKYNLQINKETDEETIIFGPAYGYDFLTEVFKLQHELEQIGQAEGKGLEHICFAPVTLAGAQTQLEDCTVQSVFGYFGNNFANFQPNTYLDVLDKCMRYELEACIYPVQLYDIPLFVEILLALSVWDPLEDLLSLEYLLVAFQKMKKVHTKLQL